MSLLQLLCLLLMSLFYLLFCGIGVLLCHFLIFFLLLLLKFLSFLLLLVILLLLLLLILLIHLCVARIGGSRSFGRWKVANMAWRTRPCGSIIIGTPGVIFRMRIVF